MEHLKKPLDFRDFDYAAVKTADDIHVIQRTADVVQVSDIRIEFVNADDSVDVFLTAEKSAVEWIKIRWSTALPKHVRILGDAWERGYGDLEWRGVSGGRILPWYFLASAEGVQYGFGVKTRPSAMCFWQADTKGITLVMDVRSGGEGILLDGRRILAAQLVSCMRPARENGQGQEGIDAFRFAQEFCRMLCPDPIFPDVPVYGSNNWYYAYGDSSEAQILKDADYLLKLTEGAKNPPFMVIDDGWEEHYRREEYCGGPWKSGNHKFPDMKGLAEKLAHKGTRPGIWMRLLLNEDAAIPDSWRLFSENNPNGILDPTHPDALAYIREDVRRICSWGYQLIKHDFSTYDLFGKWGFEMNPFVTGSGWHFYNRGMTSAEAVKLLYQAIYDEAAAYNAVVIGCNTIGHLGAGLMHLNRTGDDTSGRHWERTRRMGINTLAFRLPQHRAFFDVDADCVGIMGSIPWKFNRQWADVIAQSGTPLFVSAKPGVLNDQEKEELQKIMLSASEQACRKIPADWMDTDCPEIWTDGESRITYDWHDEESAVPECIDGRFHVSIPLS